MFCEPHNTVANLSLSPDLCFHSPIYFFKSLSSLPLSSSLRVSGNLEVTGVRKYLWPLFWRCSWYISRLFSCLKAHRDSYMRTWPLEFLDGLDTVAALLRQWSQNAFTLKLVQAQTLPQFAKIIMRLPVYYPRLICSRKADLNCDSVLTCLSGFHGHAFLCNLIALNHLRKYIDFSATQLFLVVRTGVMTSFQTPYMP